MDKVKLIYDRVVEFVELFMVKYEYENRGLLKKMKIDHRQNMGLTDARWCKLFLYKSCFNHCAKFIMLRYLEDKGFVYMKMNIGGLEKWNNFVKNITNNFDILYDIAIKDLQEDENDRIRGIFKGSDYDVFEIDEELAGLIMKNFSTINFANLNIENLIFLFQLIYSLEQREDMGLDKFYKEAPALSFVLNIEEDNGLL